MHFRFESKQYNMLAGETKVDWSEVAEVIRRGEYSLQDFPAQAPVVQAPRNYPCGDDYDLAKTGKIQPD